MDENEAMTNEELTEMQAPSDFDPEEWERKREEEREAMLAPYKEAAAMRKESAEIIAEHDDLIADMLYEMTVNEILGD